MDEAFFSLAVFRVLDCYKEAEVQDLDDLTLVDFPNGEIWLIAVTLAVTAIATAATAMSVAAVAPAPTMMSS